MALRFEKKAPRAVHVPPPRKKQECLSPEAILRAGRVDILTEISDPICAGVVTVQLDSLVKVALRQQASLDSQQTAIGMYEVRSCPPPNQFLLLVSVPRAIQVA